MCEWLNILQFIQRFYFNPCTLISLWRNQRDPRLTDSSTWFFLFLCVLHWDLCSAGACPGQVLRWFGIISLSFAWGWFSATEKRVTCVAHTINWFSRKVGITYVHYWPCGFSENSHATFSQTCSTWPFRSLTSHFTSISWFHFIPK